MTKRKLNHRVGKNKFVYPLLLLFTVAVSLGLFSQSVRAEEVSTTANRLEAGSTFTVKDPFTHWTNPSLWHNYGSTIDTSDGSYSSILVNNQASSVGYAFLENDVDMTKSFDLSGQFSFKAHSGTDPFKAGDALGFILTPETFDKIQANRINAAGSNIGIGGLSNSVFAGRDLFQNRLVDSLGTGAIDSASNDVSIRQTDATGALIRTNYANLSVPDTGNQIYQVSNVMTMNWQPETVSADKAQVTGQLTYTISSATAATQTISQTLTLSRTMKIGVVGGTGGNYGWLKLDHFVEPTRVLNQATVRYLDVDSQEEIAKDSTINAYEADVLSVNLTEDEAIRAEGYGFVAPTIADYRFASSEKMVMSANGSNLISVYYKKIPDSTVSFDFAWKDKDNTAALPQTIVLTGRPEATITVPEPTLADGVSISSVVSADGTSYASIAGAIAAYPLFKENENPHFTINLQKAAEASPMLPAIDDVTATPDSPSNITDSDETAQINSTTPQGLFDKIVSLNPISAEQHPLLAFIPTLLSPKGTQESQEKKTATAVPTAVADIEETSDAKSSKKSTGIDKEAYLLKVRLIGTSGIVAGGASSAALLFFLKKWILFLRK
ncbi:hypothetical protein [Lactococcus sp.]|uniref:lectin-like domain-containing protein n=1 Tax=Lactococcus sp. TaxID=44273 RepID=UPI0035ADB1C0